MSWLWLIIQTNAAFSSQFDECIFLLPVMCKDVCKPLMDLSKMANWRVHSSWADHQVYTPKSSESLLWRQPDVNRQGPSSQIWSKLGSKFFLGHRIPLRDVDAIFYVLHIKLERFSDTVDIYGEMPHQSLDFSNFFSFAQYA